ncbi:TPA: TetR/AcrR family transcriptional regulator, partial [Pseudomonas aeruginosa]|nr:TetR/AcrR family transcriptional regulator [Pseudomonas aeruginosa]
TETAALIMLALDGALFADLLGLPILAPAERRHFFRALQDLASGHLELVPAKGRT